MQYHIITFGCQMNIVDSKRLASILESSGYQSLAPNKTIADLTKKDILIVNMCSIRQSAVNRVYGLLPKIRTTKARTILTGCILNKDRIKFNKEFDQVLKFTDLEKYPTKTQDPTTAYISISNGCSNFCSYCVVPFTRGPLVCYDHKYILEEAKKAIAKGATEIYLLGQNVNDYQDKDINFAKLIKLVNDLPGDFKFSFISPNPKNFTDELINALAQCNKFIQKLNLPVQSGDNVILRKMNRPYTAEQYQTLVNKLKTKIPNLSLSTDIIVGFPGETKEQFANTVKLFKEVGFTMAYISKYSPRPETAALKMKDDVPIKEKQRRWNILNNMLLEKWNKN